MYKIEPTITTLEDALKYLEWFGRPHFYYFNSIIESVVLTGGSIKHHIVISLIKGYTSGRNFGQFHSYTVWRLVINDGGYRTKYGIDGKEYEEILMKMREFAEERDLKLKIIKRFLTDEAIVNRVKELGFTDFEMVKEKRENG